MTEMLDELMEKLCDMHRLSTLIMTKTERLGKATVATCTDPLKAALLAEHYNDQVGLLRLEINKIDCAIVLLRLGGADVLERVFELIAERDAISANREQPFNAIH